MSPQGPPGPSLPRCFQFLVTNAYWYMGLLPPRWRILHFPLLNFMMLLSAHFSSPLRSFSMAGWSSGESATPPSVVPSVNLLKVHSPPSQIINEDVNLDWAQCWSLGSTDAHWFPSRFCAADLHPQGWASFPSTSLSAPTAHIWTASIWRSYGRQCQKPDWHPDRKYPLLSPHTAFDLVVGWPWLSARGPNLSLSLTPLPQEDRRK